ncbi:MAG: hypothetical protein K6B68_18270 [Eubacterium sp.]|nr:hypothetical protein [Eubacterium sp.]
MIDGNTMETLAGESSETSTGVTFNARDYLNKDVSLDSLVLVDSEKISDSEKAEILDFLQGEWRTFGMGLYGRGYYKAIFTENIIQYWVDDADGNYTLDHEVSITALSKVDGKYRVTTDNMYYESDEITSTKLKSIGSNAFKGTTAKTRYKVPKSKLTKYSKMIYKAGSNKKAKITK